MHEDSRKGDIFISINTFNHCKLFEEAEYLVINAKTPCRKIGWSWKEQDNKEVRNQKMMEKLLFNIWIFLNYLRYLCGLKLA